MKTLALALAASSVALAASSAMAQAVPPLTDDIKPLRTSGLGLRVSDLDRSLKFYTEVLGMKVDQRVPATGKAVEYLLGYSGDTQTDALVVISQEVAQLGAATFGRIVLTVPNGRKLAERVKAAGGQVDKITDGTNIVHDLDGYVIELYQRPAATK